MKKKYRVCLCFFAVLLFIPFTGCEKNPSLPTSPHKPLILVSVPPYETLVRQLAGSTVDVVSIVKENTDPHVFEPRPQEVQNYKDAVLWVAIGEPFEERLLNRLKEIDPHLELLDLSKKIPLLEFNPEVPQKSFCRHCKKKDRHIWLNPILMTQQAQLIASALTQLSPNYKDLYAQNLNRLEMDLYQLNGELTHQLLPYRKTAILTSHPAFGYFCYQYDIIQLAITPDEEQQLRPQDLTHICDLAHKHDLRAVIVEPHQKNIRSVLTKCHIDNIQPVTIASFAPDYMETMKRLADAIAEKPDDPAT